MQPPAMVEEDRTAQLPDDADEIAELRRRIQALGSEVESVSGLLHTLVYERPFIIVAAATAIGYLLGRAISRR